PPESLQEHAERLLEEVVHHRPVADDVPEDDANAPTEPRHEGAFGIRISRPDSLNQRFHSSVQSDAIVPDPTGTPAASPRSQARDVAQAALPDATPLPISGRGAGRAWALPRPGRGRGRHRPRAR